MREFGKKSRLALLPLSARVLYSVFLVFTLVGLVVSAWLGETIVGLDLGKADEYYAGVTPPGDPGAGAGAPDGPALELPEEMNAPPPPEPKSFRSTLEVTHFHLFTMPIHWLVIAHLFAMCAVAERWKTTIVLTSALAMGAHIAAPWIARSGGAFSKWFYAASGVLLLATFAWMALAALDDMWRSGASSRRQPPVAPGPGNS